MFPLKSQPTNIRFDAFHILGLLGNGVGIVESKVGIAGKGFRKTEIQTNARGVSEMEISIRFRRKAGHDLGILAGVQIIFDDLF